VLRQPYRQDCWRRHSAASACEVLRLAVLGNHDSVAMVEALEALDFEVLINRSIILAQQPAPANHGTGRRSLLLYRGRADGAP
jgi:hypothetical protein